MSLCTLPAAVSAHLLTISPTANLVMFLNGNQIDLCRKSGQQVWSVRLSSRVPVASVVWSPDGTMFALLHEDGSVAVCSSQTGRPVNMHLNWSNAASVAWTDLVNDNVISTNLTDESSSVMTAINKLGGSTTLQQSGALAAVGTNDGALCISLYGALSIGNFPMNTDKVPVHCIHANEKNGEYIVAHGTCVSKVHTKFSTSHSSTDCKPPAKEVETVLHLLGLQPDNLDLERFRIQRIALAIRAVSALAAGCRQFEEALRAIATQNINFLGEMNTNAARKMLIRSLTYMSTDEKVVEWIETQHEQGFKIWYKAVSQHWETAKTALTAEIIGTAEHATVMLGSLELDLTVVKELHRNALKFLKEFWLHYDAFEQQAMFLEQVFTNEIDRPIAVTKYSSRPAESVLTSFLKQGTLGQLDPEHGHKFTEMATEIEALLDKHVENSRQDLRGKLVTAYCVDLGSKVVQLQLLDEVKQECASTVSALGALSESLGGSLGSLNRNISVSQSQPPQRVAAVLESGELAIIGSLGVEKIPLRDENPVFTGNGSDFVCLNKQARMLLHSNGTNLQLDFEPSTVVVRHDSHANRAVACVLSHDCQHYQFFEI